MLYTRYYIIQFLGILALVVGYLLSDQPDNLSMMHFNPNPACPSVFGTASHAPVAHYVETRGINNQGNSSRNTSGPRHFSFEIILPETFCIHLQFVEPVCYDQPLAESYQYLFYREINPPPPRCC